MRDVRLFKRKNGYWYTEFERGRWISLRTKDGELARKVYRRMRRDFLLGRLARLDFEKNVTLQEFSGEYLKDRRNKRARNTVDKDRVALRKLVEAVGNKKLSICGEKDFDAFVDRCLKMGNKKSTANVYLRHLKSAFTKAVKLGYVSKNPLADYKMITEHPRPTMFLSPQNVLRLVAIMKAEGEEELANFVWFSVLTGMRRSEIFNLETRDIHLDLKIIHIRKSKGRKERWVPISPFLAMVIEGMNLPQVGRMFTRYRHPDTFTHKTKEYLVKVGFKDFRLHDLRHTFASLAAIRGATQKDLKDLLGHSDIRTTDRYTHLAQDRLREVVSDLGFESKMLAIENLRVITGGKNKESKK